MQTAAHTLEFHSTTWWIWALCAAVSISITENLFIVSSVILLAVCCAKFLNVEDRYWKSFIVMLRIALFILFSRIALQILLGVPVGSDVLFRLPQIQLPSWVSGLRIGGIVTRESLLASLNDSLRISGLIVIIAAAVSMSIASRVIAQLPVAFHEIGMVIIIAFTFLPHLFEDVQRIRQASRWRGQNPNKLRTISHNLISVSESALERSVKLAAALTVRGYGKATSSQSWRKPIYFGLGIFTVEVLRMLVTHPGAFDAVVLMFGAALVIWGVRTAGKVSTRTKFRKEAWTSNDQLVVTFALTLLVTTFFAWHFLAIIFITIFAGYVIKNQNRKLSYL